MWKKYYRIADHNVVIKGVNPIVPSCFPIGFGTFEQDQIRNQLPLFTLETGASVTASDLPVQYTFLFEELDLTCEFVSGEEFFEFRMSPNLSALRPKLGNHFLPNRTEQKTIVMKMPKKSFYYITNLQPSDSTVSEFSFLLWKAFGVASASLSTVAVHASVIKYNGKCVLFLGESGTGKSTHTRLWLQHIHGSQLLNDDSPIVRIIDDIPVCFGSPWSGKGNVFLDENYPVAAIVRIRQSPLNAIKRLSKLEAFSALYPSCPPSFTIDSELTDFICVTLSIVIKKVPIYMLDCLPDSNAALLSRETIFGHSSGLERLSSDLSQI